MTGARDELPRDHFRSLGLSPFPRGWYFFATSAALKPGATLAREVAGQRFVGFRTRAGGVGVLAAQCCHFGADLSKGCVVGESLRCPYHHWRFEADGTLAEPPPDLPEGLLARQRAFRAHERHGCIFFYWGPSYEAAPPLPFHDGVDTEAFAGGRPFRYDIRTPWYAASMNAFDLRHLDVIHGRKLLEPAALSYPREDAIRIRLRSEVRSQGILNRMVRGVVGSEVDLEVTVYGGPLLLATATFRHGTSYMLFSVLPSADGSSCTAYVQAQAPAPLATRAGAARGGSTRSLASSAAHRVSLEAQLLARTLLTDLFFRKEAKEFEGIRFNPRLTLPGDECVRAFMLWAKGLHTGHDRVAGGEAWTPTNPRGHAEERDRPRAEP